MEIIKFDRVVSVNSELQGHGVQNILNGEISPNKNWMCEKGTEKAVAILQMERAVVLTSIHVGNAHSAFVEVLVGKAADSSDQFESLIPMSVFMNPHESKTGTNPNRTRFFNKSDFNEGTTAKSWDRIKVVCSQPFNKCVPYGLCFLKVHGEREAKKTEPIPRDESKDEIEIGSFFKKKRSSGGGDKQLTVSEQIREAEKETSLAKHAPISITKISEKLSTEKKQKEIGEGEHRKKAEEKTPRRKKDDDERMAQKKKKDGDDEEEGKTQKKKDDERRAQKRRKDDDDEEGKTPKRKKEKALDEKVEKQRSKEEKKKPERNRQKKPFEKLMEGVVLVISGFVNPLRGDIRSMALEMGAKYSGDWEPHCTHLVCAYDNTPKFRQVKGKGKIVTKDWVLKCHKDRKRYPWRRFALDKTDQKQGESEDEIEAGEESDPEEQVASSSKAGMLQVPEPAGRSPTRRKTDDDDYGMATDDEEENVVDTTDYPMPYVSDVFSGKLFFVDPNLNGRASLERYIIAYNGVLTEAFAKNVDFYVTEKGVPEELFRKKAPNLVVIKPSWIWEVNAKQKYVPTKPHLVQ